MLQLNRLTVSLTKHGAHKIAALLKKYDKDAILERVEGKEPGVNIDAAQAARNLSVSPTGVVPEVWNKARRAGDGAIKALVFLAIIFSHHKLIRAMTQKSMTSMRGRIDRDEVLDGKEFTNFAHTVDELGFAVSHSADYVTYNLEKIFQIPNFNKLFLELVELKFKSARWDKKSPLIDELLENDLHKVFAVSKERFKNWLTNGNLESAQDAIEDASFFTDSGEPYRVEGIFEFSAGHTPRKTGTVDVAKASAAVRTELRHNALQTLLYKRLVKEYGAACVGTEQPTGYGTSIDLVVKTTKFCWFYEIKVAATLKACIRQALPQLLEYAYWRKDNMPVDKLFVASEFAAEDEATTYLRLLRTQFKLPVHYIQIEE